MFGHPETAVLKLMNHDISTVEYHHTFKSIEKY